MPLDPQFAFDFAFGFPFRYKPQEKVAIIALDKLMTIHTHDGLKPDLTIGVGLIYQVIPNLAAFGRGEVVIAQFDPDFMTIPVTAGIQFTPKYNIDIGGEFTFGDVKNSDAPFDTRSLLLFGQLRI
jgi:hypothetical protein